MRMLGIRKPKLSSQETLREGQYMTTNPHYAGDLHVLSLIIRAGPTQPHFFSKNTQAHLISSFCYSYAKAGMRNYTHCGRSALHSIFSLSLPSRAQPTFCNSCKPLMILRRGFGQINVHDLNGQSPRLGVHRSPTDLEEEFVVKEDGQDRCTSNDLIFE